MLDDPQERPCSGPEPPEETYFEATRNNEERIGPQTRAFYRTVLSAAAAAGVPHLVGGAYSFEHYTGVSRTTKDLDLFVRRSDVRRILAALASAGCRIELTSPQWLAKACSGEDFVDVIFSSANGIAEVDDGWFRYSEKGIVLGATLDLCPVEETVWSKAFVMERDRYDGADIAHLLRARCERIDWDRLIGRFGDLWHVLLTHLILFGFVYPSERTRVPGRVMDALLSRLREETAGPSPAGRICRGTLLSPTQFLPDIRLWGYEDARIRREEP